MVLIASLWVCVEGHGVCVACRKVLAQYLSGIGYFLSVFIRYLWGSVTCRSGRVETVSVLIQTHVELNHGKVGNTRLKNLKMMNLPLLSSVYQLFRWHFKQWNVANNQGVDMLKM